MLATVVLARRVPPSLAFLTYRVPEALTVNIAIHQLVLVPFGKSFQYGIISGLNDQLTKSLPPNQKLKDIKAICNPKPVLGAEQWLFLKEISELYHTSLGWLLKNTLFPLQPSKLKFFATLSENGLNKSPLEGGVGDVGTNINRLPLSKTSPRINFFRYENEAVKQIYLLEKLASNAGQQLILVPEVSQLATVPKLLSAKLADKIVIIDSTTKPKPLFAIWLRLWRGESLIIIGTRTALFLPWQHLDAIFVLDEANPSYKSFDAAPRLETRDAARFLAWQHHAALHLMGLVPSLETYYFATQKLYDSNLHETLSKLPTPPMSPPTSGDLSLPPLPEGRLGGVGATVNVELINLNDEYYKRNTSPLSEDAQAALAQVGNNEIGICLVNHRGAASFITCQDCRFIWKCTNCEHNLIWHEQTKNLLCHYCKTRQTLPSACPNCHGTLIKLGGTGTEKIEQLLRPLAKDKQANIIRIDKDNDGIITLANHPLFIVATTAVWSQIPWAQVKTVVFVDPDTLLFIPEYRITERVWYYMQMARYSVPPTARVLIQTRHPEQAIFEHRNNPERWYTEELKQRRRFKYPPYWFLLKLGYHHPNRTSVVAEAGRLYEQLKTLTLLKEDAIVLPPVASFPERIRNNFGQILIVKIKLSSYKKTTKRIMAAVPPTWKADLNPQDLLGAL